MDPSRWVAIQFGLDMNHSIWVASWFGLDRNCTVIYELLSTIAWVWTARSTWFAIMFGLHRTGNILCGQDRSGRKWVAILFGLHGSTKFASAKHNRTSIAIYCKSLRSTRTKLSKQEWSKLVLMECDIITAPIQATIIRILSLQYRPREFSRQSLIKLHSTLPVQAKLLYVASHLPQKTYKLCGTAQSNNSTLPHTVQQA
jgi:hypothetical protein